MTSGREGPPSVNDAFTVKKVTEGGRRRSVRAVDLSKATGLDDPPPNDKSIQDLLEDVRSAKRNKTPEYSFGKRAVY